MVTTTFANNGKIRQLAYIVPDLRAAIAEHHEKYGSGPYYLYEGDDVSYLYRGRPSSTKIDVALGQWGDVQVELIQLNDDQPSVFREVAPVGFKGSRIHHICLHPKDIDLSIAAFEAAGHELAFDLIFPGGGGTRNVMVDTLEAFGHFTQLYQSTPEIAHFYGVIRDASLTFGGKRLFRELSEVNRKIWSDRQ